MLAYLLVLHLVSLPFVFRKRGEPAPVIRAAWLGLGFGVLQVVLGRPGWCWAGFPASCARCTRRPAS